MLFRSPGLALATLRSDHFLEEAGLRSPRGSGLPLRLVDRLRNYRTGGLLHRRDAASYGNAPDRAQHHHVGDFPGDHLARRSQTLAGVFEKLLQRLGSTLDTRLSGDARNHVFARSLGEQRANPRPVQKADKRCVFYRLANVLGVRLVPPVALRPSMRDTRHGDQR